MNYYVYRIDDPITNEYYYGSRGCNCDISDDIYMGTPTTWEPANKERLVKTIIKSGFGSREDAYDYEANIIEIHINDPLNENYHIPNKGFRNIGRQLSNETKSKISDGMRGIKNRLGTKVSEETKKLLSEIRQGQVPWNKDKTNVFSEETRKHWSEQRRDRTVTEDFRDEMRTEYKTSIRSNIVECPHCSKNGGYMPMKRWHFDNCKNKL